MIFNINALISVALAASNISGAIRVPASIMNAVSLSLCGTTVGGYEQHSSPQLVFFFLRCFPCFKSGP